MRKAMKWTNRVISTILLIALLLMVFAVISSRAAGGQPNLFGYQLKTVLSGSMEPGIQTGSIIATEPVKDPTHFQKGDIITFRIPGGDFVTHRIFAVKNNGLKYVTKGDNNEKPDPSIVPATSIVGEYTGFTIPYVGYFLHFSKTQQGTALLLIVPGILLLIYAGVSIWRGISSLEKEQKKTASEKSI